MSSFSTPLTFIALSVESDEHHHRAEELAEQLLASQTPIVTTRAVLLEIGNALSKQRYRKAAGELLDAIEHDPKSKSYPSQKISMSVR